VRFADVALLDQNGMPVRLEKDLVGDHLVVMGFIYTSCTTVCPVVSSIMGKVQQQLGGRVGEEIRLVSISVDPSATTPNAWPTTPSQPRPGWSWLIGSPYAITETLKGCRQQRATSVSTRRRSWWGTGAAGTGRASTASPSQR
jgi:protein SCO1/2